MKFAWIYIFFYPPKCSLWNLFHCEMLFWGDERVRGGNESNTANQFTADNICYKLFLLCGRLTNSRWKRWRGRVSEALPMWQAISGLRVISVPYSRQLASHAWLLHARRSMPTDGFLFPFPRRSEISHLNSGVQRRKLIQRKKNPCVVFSSSQCFARSVCSDQEALMGNFWVQARQAGSADAEQEVSVQCFIAIPHRAHTERHSSCNPVNYLTVCLCLKYWVWQSFDFRFQIHLCPLQQGTC